MPDRDKWIHGRGASATTGFYRDVAASTRGKRPSTNEPADWPWSKKYREKYGKNIGFGKPTEQTFDDPMTPDEKEALKRNKKGTKTKAEALIEAVIAIKEGLVDDAKRNLVAAGLFDADSDYDGMLGSAVLELVKKFAKQGHSGASAYMTLELFDKVAKRKPLTAKFWHEEKQRLLKWLKDEGQLDGKHAMTQEMVDRFIADSLGPCPRTRVNESNGDGMGDCFEVAGRMVVNCLMPPFAQERFSGAAGAAVQGRGRDELVLVHAEITGQGPIAGIKHGHAWVETADGKLCIDASNGKDLVMPKATFYKIARVTKGKVYKYTPEEVRDKILSIGHWGPWELKTEH